MLGGGGAGLLGAGIDPELILRKTLDIEFILGGAFLLDDVELTELDDNNDVAADDVMVDLLLGPFLVGGAVYNELDDLAGGSADSKVFFKDSFSLDCDVGDLLLVVSGSTFGRVGLGVFSSSDAAVFL